jgi:hypothetical protein
MYNYNQMKSDAGEKVAARTALVTAGATVGAFIPGVGLIAPLAAGAGLVATSDNNSATQTDTLIIDFKKGLVSSCVLQRITSTAHVNALGTVDGKTASSEINCGQIKGST